MVFGGASMRDEPGVKQNGRARRSGRFWSSTKLTPAVRLSRRERAIPPAGPRLLPDEPFSPRLKVPNVSGEGARHRTLGRYWMP